MFCGIDSPLGRQQHLFNKLLGQLRHCLQQKQTFDGAKAFPMLSDAGPKAEAIQLCQMRSQPRTT